MLFSDFIKDTLDSQNKIQWNYYHRDLNTANILEPNIAKDFIHDYFQNGEKGLVLQFDMGQACELPLERATHTVSGFFLGLLLESCLTGKDTLTLKSNTNFHFSYPFSYLWFLTFLYHDYGYCVTESKDCPTNDVGQAPVPHYLSSTNINGNEYKPLARIKKELNINLSPFSAFRNSPKLDKHVNMNNTELTLFIALLRELTQSTYRISNDNKLYFSNHSIITKNQYKKATYIRYLNYRINEWNVADHGIIGGFLFYDKMVKNYVHAYLLELEDNHQISNLADFYHNGRHFSTEQLIIFSYIADCIMSHNIFKENDNNREVYENYQLFELFTENYKRITFEDNPLLYILTIADSLDPIKIYGKPAREVTTAIDVEYQPGSRIIIFSSISNSIDITTMYNKAKDLEDWTTVTCEELIDGKFVLHI